MIFPRDWGWSWWSWRQLRHRVAQDAARVECLPAGAAVAFPYRPAPRRIAFDLALQATGREPLPFTGAQPPGAQPPEAQSAGAQLSGAQPSGAQGVGFSALAHSWAAEAWARFEGEDLRGPEALPALTLPATEPELGEAEATLAARPAACVRPWAGQAPLELDQETLAQAAELLEHLLETGGPRRPIALVCGPLEELAERLWLAWGLHRGAALVLAREPSSTGWALHWSRPTVACLPAAWLPGIRELLVRQGKPGALRRRLQRLRRVLAWGELTPGQPEAWSELGLEVLPFPRLLPASPPRPRVE